MKDSDLQHFWRGSLGRDMVCFTAMQKRFHYTEKSKPRFLANPTQKPRVKKIFLEQILRFIQNVAF